jgi:hypothetical protein
MFSINRPRSLVTLAVMAGLLAAAAPASAAVPSAAGAAADGPGSRVEAANIKAVVVLIGANDYGFARAVGD